MKFRNLSIIGVFSFLLIFSVSCVELTGTDGTSTGSSTDSSSSEDTRSVTGQVDLSEYSTQSLSYSTYSKKGHHDNDQNENETESSNESSGDAVCDIDGDFVVRAVPASGQVVDTTLDNEGVFTLLLLADRGYSLLFYQDEILCGYLLNSVSGAHSLVGYGDNNFDFGMIEMNEDGQFIPENDCEDYYDTDEDGYVDSDDDDFDGNGYHDDDEADYDEDGVMDEWDCDYDDDGNYDEDVYYEEDEDEDEDDEDEDDCECDDDDDEDEDDEDDDDEEDDDDDD
jgi:hypothetical protein